MSEYIEVKTNFTDDPDVIVLSSNLILGEESEEIYTSIEEMEEGTAVAQTLAKVEGLKSLIIYGKSIEITRDPNFDWHVIVAEVNSALKDFFL
jgi:hypothetical protein